MATKTDAGFVTKTSAQAGKTGKTAKAGKAPQIATQAAQTAAKTARGTRSAAKLKAERQARIRALVTGGNMATQEDLARALQEEGFQLTQATVSRDIRELMLVKVPDAEGGYRYAFPQARAELVTPSRMERTLQDSVVRLDCAANLVVVHTLPGTAAAVAYVVDYMKWPQVLGTIAGDDTIFVACADGAGAQQFVARLSARLRALDGDPPAREATGVRDA